jgi:carboxymethylenebutenolidase
MRNVAESAGRNNGLHTLARSFDMCFDLDSTPPIPAAAGPSVERTSLVLSAADGNRFKAFHSIPNTPKGRAILILPDTRGLHHYYEELAVRFAEAGVEALAMDYFGRTAGTADRDDSFDHNSHVAKTTWTGLRADIVAAAGYLHDHAARRTGGAAASRPPAIFVTGFCMGGRNAFLSATLGLGLSGVIGFYGFPGGTFGNGAPAPTDTVAQIDCPVLGIFGGADQNIPIAMIQSFRDALTAAGVEHDIVVEPDAPHSFFDKTHAQFQVQSDDAWARVRRFIDAHGAA